MHKKKIFILTISLLATMLFINVETANAQLVRYGFKGGVDIIDHKINTGMLNTRNRLGFQLGGTLEFAIPLIGNLETSLLYGHKKYEAKFKEDDSSISDYNYLTLPVNFKKRWGLTNLFGIYAYAGPYAMMKLNGGNIKTQIEDVKHKNFGMGLNFGAGVKLFKHIDLGIQYRVDLTNQYSSNKASIGNFAKKKHQAWNVGLTYFFN